MLEWIQNQVNLIKISETKFEWTQGVNGECNDIQTTHHLLNTKNSQIN